MNLSIIMIITSVISFIMIILGFVLTITGKPYNKIVLTIHKILSFLSAGFIVFIITEIYIEIDIISMQIFFIIITGLLFMVAFISGIFIIVLKKRNKFILYTHRITAILAIIFGVVAIKLFN